MHSIRTCIVALLGIGQTLAGADASAPKPAEPTEDAIAVAKREFDAVKSARANPEPASAALPTFTAPQLQVGGTAPTAPAARVEERPSNRVKSQNWLLDAMGASERERTTHGAREVTADDLENKGANDPSGSRDREKRPDKKQPNSVANPLDRYMEAWMTPQDLALLRPVMRGEPSGSWAGGDPLKIASLAESARGQTMNRETSSFLSSGGAGRAAAGRENPYLVTLGPPTPAAGPATAALPPAPIFQTNRPNAMAPATPAPDPASAQKTPTPSFVKPRDDEKFNKQMKRF